MSFTRAEIQSFIDGYLKAGGNPDTIVTDIDDWMEKHTVYPQGKQVRDTIKADIESYRGVPKTVPPEPVAPVVEEEVIP